uniref:(northern house mosquito) hypothetical protein n=1 Tax=Culex pipiens TaxID=7175 RepID=A0A8D8G981_CULPI
MPESPLLHLSRRWDLVFRRSLLERQISGPKRWCVVSWPCLVLSLAALSTLIVVTRWGGCCCCCWGRKLVPASNEWEPGPTDDRGWGLAAALVVGLNWAKVFLNFCSTLSETCCDGL